MVDLGHGDVPQPAATETVAVNEGSRALVVAEVSTAADRRNALVRPAAPFVAQLIATATGSPQTRVLRRAEPTEAASAYGARPAAVAPTELLRIF